MKNILENNKLLAEFLEFEKVKFLNGCYTFIIPDYLSHGEYKNLTLEDNKEVVAWDVENLIFHKDWNWLMKVVEKIHSMQSYGVFINPNGTYIQDEDDKVICMTFKNEEVNGEIISSSNIEATFNCCVEFIKWYNSHLCSNCGRFDDVVGTHNIDTCEECALNS